MDWYKFRPAQWYRQTRNMTPAEKGDFMDKTVDALEDEAEGITPLADRMLAEALSYSERQRDSARARWKGEAAEDANAMPPDANGCQRNANRCHNTPTHRQTDTPTDNTDKTDITTPTHRPDTPTDTPTDPHARGKGSGRIVGSGIEGGRGAETVFGGKGAVALAAAVVGNGPADDYERLCATKDCDLPAFAAEYCREENPTRAMTEYGKAMAEMGADKFRILLDAFIGDMRTGEEPRSRGAVFMSRVMKELGAARDAKRRRGYGEA
ncbi:MAG: hypothetical protein IKO01_11290 [Kiritimatiellae bacterium]|nr:hypothetical protein [Kiritimatiellia bacterium]